jgi:ER lumen protein retaining receptor
MHSCYRWIILVKNSLTVSSGISFKTQALYVAVFVARYPDLVYHYISIYNSAMKLFFISSSCYILYLMRYRYR